MQTTTRLLGLAPVAILLAGCSDREAEYQAALSALSDEVAIYERIEKERADVELAWQAQRQRLSQQGAQLAGLAASISDRQKSQELADEAAQKIGKMVEESMAAYQEKLAKVDAQLAAQQAMVDKAKAARDAADAKR